MPSLERDGDVHVLLLGDDENRLRDDWVAQVTELVDEVAAKPSPRALVTAARGKFWSNGLDLEWMGRNQERLEPFIADVHEMFARVLVAPMPTVAAVQGHCFAAGAMLALAHDWRVMRADRGFFCLPEADIDIPFTPGMNDLIRAKVTPQTATEAMVGARRYGGEDAKAAGLVDATATEDEVLARAVELAAAHAGKQGPTLATIKERLYAPVLATLRDASANRLATPA
jgi:enoyl-CoA hydratase/carnithine racemase